VPRSKSKLQVRMAGFTEKLVPEVYHRGGLTYLCPRKQRGEGKLKAIIYTAILLAAVFAAIKILPAYVAEYQLADKMQELARFAVVNRYTDEQIRDNVYRAMQDLDIPAKREDIKVIAGQSGTVKISLDYTVPVDLLIYHLELHFSPSSEAKSLT
jgi:hypothetical protein